MKNFAKLFIIIALVTFQVNLKAGSVITDSTYLYNQLINGINNSEYIFEGEVIDIQSYWNDDKNYIYTSYTIKVSKYWKAENLEPIEELKLVEVITRGGSIENTSLSISHQIGFSVGQKGMFITEAASYPFNPNSSVEENDQLQLHDGLYFDYDYSKGYISANFSSLNFECIDLLYETIDTNYIADCLGVYPNGILQQNTYNDLKLLTINKQNSITTTAGTITYTFENVKTTTSNSKNFLEYDIFIESSNNAYFDNGGIYVQYNSQAFGSNIVGNNKITMQRGTVMASVIDYDAPVPGDDQPNIFSAIFFGKNGVQNRFYLSMNTPEQLAHVRMEILDCSKLPDLKFVDQSTMLNFSAYTSTAGGTNFRGWDNIVANDTENSSLCSVQIYNFSPQIVHGGTNDLVTISGNFFGNTKGSIQMKNSNDGGSTWITLDDYDIISWNNTEIVIKIPSRVPLNVNLSTVVNVPGTGKLKVITHASSSTTSEDNLTIDYSWKNTIRGTSPTLVKQKIFLAGMDLVYDEDLQNQKLGYMFIPNFNMTSNSKAITVINTAVDDWVCASEIRWDLSPNPQDLAEMKDDISIIRFGNIPTSNVLGETSTWRRVCDDGNGGALEFVSDIDIVISDRSTFTYFYDETKQLPVPTGQYDFYSLILHELGHGVLQNHVNDESDFMRFDLELNNTGSILPADRRISFTLGNLEGSDAVVVGSALTDFTSCHINNNPLAPLQKSNCTVSLVEYKAKESINLKAFPNPFNNSTQLSFNLSNDESIIIKMFDINGRTLYSEPTKEYYKGENSINLEFSNIDNGIYIIRLISSHGSHTIKVINGEL